MTKSELFKKAHALAKATVKAGDNYQATFALCLKAIYQEITTKCFIVKLSNTTVQLAVKPNSQIAQANWANTDLCNAMLVKPYGKDKIKVTPILKSGDISRKSYIAKAEQAVINEIYQLIA